MKPHRIALSIAICALMTITALANVKSKSVTFSKDLSVGGSLVKKGSYKVSFDEAKNELTIYSGKREVARSTARLEERKLSSKYEGLYSSIRDANGNDLLLSVNIGGKYAVINDQHTARVMGASASGGLN